MLHVYPLYLHLESKLCLVVGSGKVGLRKARGVLEAGGRVRLVSTSVLQDTQYAALEETNIKNDQFEISSRNPNLDFILAAYDISHLEGCFLAFAATDSHQVNTQIALDARSLGILVNCADGADQGDFTVPGVVRRGELTIAVSTGGASPKLSSRIVKQLSKEFGPEYSSFVALLAEMREYIKSTSTDQSAKDSAHWYLLEAHESILELIRANRLQDARAMATNAANLGLTVKTDFSKVVDNSSI